MSYKISLNTVLLYKVGQQNKAGPHSSVVLTKNCVLASVR